MTEKEPAAKATAPLISLRRSFRLHSRWIVLLEMGLWEVIGIFGLYEQAHLLAGSSTGWAYLAGGVLLVPSILTFIELRSWAGHTGGSYRLIRAVERNNLTFFAGWIYVLGWASISALLALTFASYGTRLLEAISPLSVQPIWLIAALLIFFVVSNALRLRPWWRISAWAAGLTVALLIALASALLVRTAAQPARILRSTASSNPSFFGAVAVLIAAMWAFELMAGAGERRWRTPRLALFLLIGGPLLGGLIALGARWAAPGAGTLEAVAQSVFPGSGPILILALGTLVTGIAWQVLGLLTLRRFQIIGLDGWLPDAMLASYGRFKSPLLLIVVQVALTIGALLLGTALTRAGGSAITRPLNLAALAALAYLLIQIGVSLAGIILGDKPRAAERDFRLPLYPAIPATALGINALLILALPPTVLLVGAAWLALGALVYWRIGQERMRASRLGVTVFQDVAAPAGLRSAYPVLVPVANPDTAMNLVNFAAAIARAHDGHVTVLQVVPVPEQQPLDTSRYKARARQSLLERVLAQRDRYDVPIEGITRLARHVPQGILDTIGEESPQVLVMGWNARQATEDRQGLGHILDEVLQNAPCNIVIVRGEWQDSMSSILVPAAGGPHAPVAAQFALDVTEQTGGEVALLNVKTDDETTLEERLELVNSLREELSAPERVEPCVIEAETPLEGILKALEEHDAVFLGASEHDFLDRQLFGQIPIQVAHNTDKMLALVHGHTPLTEMVARKALSSLSDVLPSLTPDEQLETYYRMRRAAHPSVNFFVLIAASAVIATLGLLLNSVAVIIGAMLVAPLMSPFISMAMGIVTGDVQTMRSAGTSIFQGTLLSIFIAIISTLISPLAEATPEILARTQPNLLDLLIALVSGVAGAYAIARKEVEAALPGVAIAAALMPPLCTIGIGVALGNPGMAGGALLLYLTNLVAIVFASAIVLLLLGMRPPQRADRQRWLRQGLAISLISLAVVSIPLGFFLFRAAQRSQVESQTQAIFREHVQAWEVDGELANLAIDMGWREVAVSGTLYVDTRVTPEQIDELDRALERALDRDVDVRLFVIEGEVLQTNPP